MAEAKDSSKLHFVKGSAHRIAARSWPEISELRGRYYLNTLSRTPTEINRFLSSTTAESWADPNLSPQARSRYARARAIGAYRGDKLTAFALAANNASSQRDGLLGTLEEQTKLHLPVKPFVEARHVAIREIIGDEDATVMAGMTAHLLGSYRPEQPVSAYVYEDEESLRQTLEDWGMHTDGEPEAVHPYGGLGDPEYQTRMAVDHAEDMIDVIIASQAVRQVWSQIERDVSLDTGSGMVFPPNYM